MDSDSRGEKPLTRKTKSVELSVFLFLILAWLGPSSFLLRTQVHLRFRTVAVSTILGDLALVSLVIFFLWRNGEPVREIGWVRRRWGQEAAWGVLLFLPAVSSVNVLQRALRTAGFSAPSSLPSYLSVSSAGGAVLAFVLVIVVAVVEETIFRGYLISRLRTATGRTGAAVLLSSSIFSLGHGYEGTAGMVSVLALGVILAVVYLWRRSLVAPIVMHFLTDFTSIVLAALSSRR